MTKQVSKINFKGIPVFVGIDVHKLSWRVAFCTENTPPSLRPITISKPFVANLSNYLGKHYPGADIKIAYEAGFCGFWISQELVALGYTVLVVNPADIPTSDKERKQKEDSRDARKIARSLKENSLVGIYVPSQAALKSRSLVRERYSIAKSLRRVKIQIRSHLNFYHIETTEAGNYWSNRYINELTDIASKESDSTLCFQLSRLNDLRSLILRINKELRIMSRSDEFSKLHSLLISVPGVGMLTALQLITEIVEMKRFSSFDKLCSYIGFIPMTFSSAENQRVGPLTKRSNRRLRAALVESSWVAIQYDQELQLKYEQYCKRMKGQQAIIYIAKILLRKIRYVWLNQEMYQKNVNLTNEKDTNISIESK